MSAHGQLTEGNISSSANNSSPTGTGRSERLVAIALLIVITSAVYFPVIDQEFSHWDDMKYVSVIWKPSWDRGWKIATDYKLRYITELYYNPIHFLSLMADQALVGSADRPQAWIAKLANVGYHSLNSLLVFALLLSNRDFQSSGSIGGACICGSSGSSGDCGVDCREKELACHNVLSVFSDSLREVSIHRIPQILAVRPSFFFLPGFSRNRPR